MLKSNKWRQYLLLSLFFCVSEILASTLASQIEVGDWILRSGRGRESALIKLLSHSQFSHIGMVVSVKPEVIIIHATTNDKAQYPNQVIESTLKEFTAKQLSSHTIVVRPKFINAREKEAIAQYMLQYLGQSFELVSRDNSPRYCTTIIYDSIRQIYPDFELPWQSVTLSLVNGEYLFPQAFLDYPNVEMIFDSAN